MTPVTKKDDQRPEIICWLEEKYYAGLKKGGSLIF